MILSEEVEVLRKQLNDIIACDDKEMILRISRELDELIVRYYRECYRYNLN